MHLIECEEVLPHDRSRLLSAIYSAQRNGLATATPQPNGQTIITTTLVKNAYLELSVGVTDPNRRLLSINLKIPNLKKNMHFVLKRDDVWYCAEKDCDFLQRRGLRIAQLINEALPDEGGAVADAKVGMRVGAVGYYI